MDRQVGALTHHDRASSPDSRQTGKALAHLGAQHVHVRLVHDGDPDGALEREADVVPVDPMRLGLASGGDEG